jgi:hypothetical protein
VGIMTDEKIILIERACERLVVDFAYFSDRREYEPLAALFAENGVMRRPSGDPLIGRAAILESYRSRPAGRITRHICTNIRVTVESDTLAHGLTYAVVYSADPGQPPEQRIGEFEDEFVLTPDGWRLGSRQARFVIST